ncbi:hypothetical protein BRPE64_ACDS19130 [Caballeronia insecticola]|uniref:Uncharacterized protein n=1 Tax=Caballeronia insecticola TaxID=758793 RepID=R4WZ72_9BURK|nr:hypothetical protein BRPE64_ACDS19130 [Caballeronia insecticola]
MHIACTPYSELKDGEYRSALQLEEKNCRARAEEAEHRDAHCHRQIHDRSLSV